MRPQDTTERPSGASGLARCETIAASGVHHIRRLTDAGMKPNGGADTRALCGANVLWDVVLVTDEWLRSRPHYGWPCPRRIAALDSEAQP